MFKNICSKLAGLALISGLILGMTGCDNKPSEQELLKEKSVQNYHKYLSNGQNIILKNLENNNLTYKEILSKLTENAQMTEQEVYELLKTNYSYDKSKQSVYKDTLKQEEINEMNNEKEFTINFLNKKFNISNKSIPKEAMDTITKKSIQESLEKDLSFDEMTVDLLNKSYGIATLYSAGQISDINNIDEQKIEEKFLVKFKSDDLNSDLVDYYKPNDSNLTNIEDNSFVNIFSITREYKELSDTKNILKSMNEKLENLKENKIELEKELRKGTISETEIIELNQIKEYLVILEKHIVVVQEMVITNELELQNNSQMMPGGYSSRHTNSSSSSGSSSSFVNGMIFRHLMNNNSNYGNTVSSMNSNRGYSSFSSSHSSRGGYGG